MICYNCNSQLPDNSTYLPPQKRGNWIAMGITIGALYMTLVILVILLVCQRNYKDKEEDMIAPLTTYTEDLISSISIYDGTYVLESVSALGLTYSREEMEAMTGESFDMKLIIAGDKCTLNANSIGYDMASCSIAIDGNDITLDDGIDEITGFYDEQEESITLYSSGVDMKFVKQKN
ncbi:MAG: hypothetical protein E7263_01570 [Lachnospiraceae bacterium]|nr:hypothetical protein [Lachnospiraceae bacterium]